MEKRGINERMNELSQLSCEACRIDAPHVSDEELKTLIKEIPDWSVVNENNILKLRRAFKFKNFIEALDFGNRTGALAEQHGHHPDLFIEWGKITVTWWSHKMNGLHKNDFIMAAKTDRL